MMRYKQVMSNFRSILNISILLLTVACTLSEECKTEVDILWQKYGELKADIERLKAQVSGSSCTSPSTAEIPVTSTATPFINESHKNEMKDFGFELISVTKQSDSVTNETEITVILLAPEGAVFYWFESFSQFIPAYENGTISTLLRRGKMAQVKIKKYFRDPRHVFFGFSNFTSFHIILNIESGEQEYSSLSPSNCKYSPVKRWETDSTINSEITLKCDPMFRNITKLSERPNVSAIKREDGIELKETMPDSQEFNASQAEQSDGSVLVEASIRKQNFKEYDWINYGLTFSRGDDKLVESINFWMVTYMIVNGEPKLPNGFVGIFRLGYKTFIEGEHSFIACSALGNPLPNVNIAKKDEKYGDLHYLATEQSDNSLDAVFIWSELTSVSLSDAGEYSCLTSVNGHMESINFTVNVRPKNYSFDVRDITVNTTRDNAINVTFKALGFNDINVSCSFYNAPFIPGQTAVVNDTVTISNIGQGQALLKYGALVDSSYVSIGQIDCDVTDKFNFRHISVPFNPGNQTDNNWY